MKSLDDFFNKKINNNHSINIVGGTVGPPTDSMNECHEDTFGNGCDEFVEFTNDDGTHVASYTFEKKCDPA